MNTILVVDQEPRICGVIRDFFENNRGMPVQCAHTGSEATRMLMHNHYELALISAPLPGSSDFDLSMLSVKERIPALLMTRDPVLRLMLQQFAFPYLGKPFTPDAVRVAAERVMSDPDGHLARLEASLGMLRTHRNAQVRMMNESDRLLSLARAQQQLGHWDFAVARVKASSLNEGTADC
jgi:DNA-binding NtrC family response regulator